MEPRVRYRTRAFASVWGSLLCLTFSLSSQEVELIDCEGEWADSPLCKEREEAFELKARVDYIFEELPELEDPPWNIDQHQEALANYEKAMSHYNEGFYGDSVKLFDSVLESISSLKSEFDEAAAQTEELAFSLLEEENYHEAMPLLKDLVRWMPSLSRAADGLAVATKAIELEAAVARLEELSANQAFDDVEVELETFPSGYWEHRVGEIRNRLSRHRHEQSFNSLMSQGFERLNAGQWEAAQTTFQRALKLSPNSTVAKESLEEASAQLTKSKLTFLHENLTLQEKNEQWEQMLKTLSEIDQWVTREDTAKTRKRVQQLLNTEAQLIQAIPKASSPMDRRVRTEVQELIASSAELDSHNRINQQRSTLVEEFERNTKRVSITVISDGATNVLVRSGPELGKFSKRVLNVYPGSYEFIGRRKGYHETRQSITIDAGSQAVEIRVVCDVKF